MSHRFPHHYTAAEATALIPKLARWLEEMRLLRQSLDRQGERLAELLDDSGDQGGSRVNSHTRGLVRWRELAAEFSHRGLQIRDFEAGENRFPLTPR